MEGFGPLGNSVLVSVLGMLMAFATAWFWFSRNIAVQRASAIAADHEKVKARLEAAESKLALIDQVITPINTMMQALLVKQLTHYHTPEMDALMVKLGPPNTLSHAEEARLLVLLEERTRDMHDLITPEERDAAVILPVIMKRARAEQKSITDAAEVGARLVAVVSLIAVPADTAEAARKL
jgi:hypothetical protein